eukprot:g35728.t1
MLEIVHGDKMMSLRLNAKNAVEAMERAVRNRLSIAQDQALFLRPLSSSSSSSSSSLFPLSPHLPAGRYELATRPLHNGTHNGLHNRPSVEQLIPDQSLESGRSNGGASDTPSGKNGSPVEFVGSPDKSPEDTRQYRVVRLSNSLLYRVVRWQYRVVRLSNSLLVALVSDTELEKGAAALDVFVGHMSDPDSLPGLAHFLEHMLFLGTSKYPDEGSYRVFLNKHGGSSNASTGTMHTCYHFNVLNAHLEEALDRFSQFFISPLMTQGMTERELRAVDSEHQKNLQQDVRRHWHLNKSTSNPKHPFSKFGTGSLETLQVRPEAAGINVREALLSFHRTYYSASIMRAAIVGNQSLDTLQAWAVEKFAGIPNTGRSVPRMSSFGDPFAPKYGKLYRITPVRDLRVLKFYFAVPFGLAEHYRSMPQKGLSHLLGHEGPGSVLAYLKAQGWVNELTAGMGIHEPEFGAFSLSLELSIEGQNHLEDITRTVFAYIQLLQKATEADWQRLYQELRDMEGMQFRFKERDSASDLAERLAYRLQYTPPVHILSHSYVFPDFSLPKIKQMLACLKPESMWMFFISKTNEKLTHQRAPWGYQTPYQECDFPAGLAQAASDPGTIPPHLHLPAPNPYIPSDFTLVARPTAVRLEREVDPPLLLAHDAMGEFWYKLDQVFLKPRAMFSLQLVSPCCSKSARDVVLANLFTRLLTDAYTTEFYEADLAGLKWHVSSLSSGIEVEWRGYNHKLVLFIRTGLHALRNFQAKGDRFDIIKEEARQHLVNWDKGMPINHACEAARLVLEDVRFTSAQELEALAGVSLQDFNAYATRFFASFYYKALVHGNIELSQARALAATTRQILLADGVATATATATTATPDHKDQGKKKNKVRPLFPAEFPEKRTLMLDENVAFFWRQPHTDPQNPNSATDIHFQLGKDSLELRMRAVVAAHLIKAPCFNQLRTTEALGYIVWSGTRVINDVIFLRARVQSGQPPDYLDSRIEAFFDWFVRTKLATMTEEVWKENLSAVIEDRSQKPKKLKTQHEKYWDQITLNKYDFGKLDKEVATLRTLTREGMVKFFAEYVLTSAPQRRKLSSQVFSGKFPPPFPGILSPASCDDPAGQEASRYVPDAKKGKEKKQAKKEKNTEKEKNAEKEGPDEGKEKADKVLGPPVPRDVRRVCEIRDLTQWKTERPAFAGLPPVDPARLSAFHTPSAPHPAPSEHPASKL